MARTAAGEVTSAKGAFRRVMGQFPTGVTIVTTRSDEGEVAGLTVNSFTSVSLDPPMVLFCVDSGSVTLPFFRENGTFAANILTHEQESLSRCFASSSRERYEQFCHAPSHTATTGSPILDGALAFIEARIVAEYPGGDHVIFLGLVVMMGTDDGEYSALGELSTEEPGEVRNKSPLVYYRAQYRSLAPDDQRDG